MFQACSKQGDLLIRNPHDVYPLSSELLKKAGHSSHSHPYVTFWVNPNEFPEGSVSRHQIFPPLAQANLYAGFFNIEYGPRNWTSQLSLTQRQLSCLPRETAPSALRGCMKESIRNLGRSHLRNRERIFLLIKPCVSPDDDRGSSPVLQAPPWIPADRTNTRRRAAWRQRPLNGHPRLPSTMLDENRRSH